MSRQAGSIVRGISKPRRISARRAGCRWPVIYCRPGKRSRYGVPRGSKRSPFGGSNEKDRRPLVNPQLQSCFKYSQARDPDFKSSRLSCALYRGARRSWLCQAKTWKDPRARRHGPFSTRRTTSATHRPSMHVGGSSTQICGASLPPDRMWPSSPHSSPSSRQTAGSSPKLLIRRSF